MWDITKIKIKNFRSFLDDEFSIQHQDQTFLIFGQHEQSTEYSNSNGSGKSSFLKSIEFALLGVVSRNLPKEEYIHNGESECSVTLFMNNQSIGKELIVKRSIFRSKSKPARVLLIEDGVENKDLINEQEANKRIEFLLGIAKEDILNYFIVGQSNQMSFLRTTDQRQKEIISRFANLESIDKILLNIKEQITLLERESQEYKSANLKMLGSIELLEQQISTIASQESEKGEQELNQHIISAQSKMKEASEEKIKIEKQIEEIEEILIELKYQYENFQDLEQKLDENRANARKQKKELQHLLQAIEGQVSCPECGHDFLLGEKDMDLEGAKQLVGELNKSIDQSKMELTVLEGLEEERSGLIKEIKTLRSEKRSLETELEMLDRDINFLNNKIQKKKRELDESIRENKDNKFKKTLELDLTKNKEKLKENQEKINEIESRVFEYKFWQVNFGNRGFKTFLVNKVLSIIEGNMNFYLQKISNFQIKIEGYKTLADGSIRDKISVTVSRDGLIWENYEKFSGGQQTRIDICAVLALRRIINQNASISGGGMNFLGLDEAFDGLDSMGQKHVVDTLQAIGETCFVISHTNDSIDFPNKLMIKCKNGVSRIKQ